eukprot:SAG11_NODE_37915_length_254_cov_1.658065_1_plen_64_part_01
MSDHDHALSDMYNCVHEPRGVKSIATKAAASRQTAAAGFVGGYRTGAAVAVLTLLPRYRSERAG